MTFSELGIIPTIIQALEVNKIIEPTDVQLQVIPHILNTNKDLVAIAQTGTGKTAAFALPILQTIDPKLDKIQALVIVPTRELGQQVAREFFLFSKFMTRIFVESVYGGVPIIDQIDKLKRTTHIVVATPGRLIDLLDRGALSLDNLKYLVLDEADEMMNMGFKTEIDEILKSCKDGITKMLFTATMPNDVTEIISDYIQPDFVEIRINAEEFVNQNIKHSYLVYQQGDKLDSLKVFLSKRPTQRGIVFCRTKVAAKRLAKQLAGFVVVADALHGNLNQEMRDKVMRGFKNHRINLLVATDIAARGIDVKDLDYVIHYHLPEKMEYYTHRSGRTARAGKTGNSICLIKEEELDSIKSLENELNIEFSELSVILPEIYQGLPITIYMNMGYNQNFDKYSLIDFLIEEAGLNGSDIENVKIEEEEAQFDIPENYQQQVFLNLKNIKLFCRNLKLSLDKKANKRR
ncbi:MAG: DEAD/DEAH box helicase [Bacteroidota bacterium]